MCIGIGRFAWETGYPIRGLGVSPRNAGRNEARRRRQRESEGKASRPPVIELVTRPRTLIKILAGRM